MSVAMSSIKSVAGARIAISNQGMRRSRDPVPPDAAVVGRTSRPSTGHAMMRRAGHTLDAGGSPGRSRVDDRVFSRESRRSRGRGVDNGSHPPISTVARVPISRLNERINTVLPDPASPPMNTADPRPSRASSREPRSVAIASLRSNNASDARSACPTVTSLCRSSNSMRPATGISDVGSGSRLGPGSAPHRAIFSEVVSGIAPLGPAPDCVRPGSRLASRSNGYGVLRFRGSR